MAMSDEARELRNKYYRDYRRKHKERLKEQAKEFWERKAKNLGLKEGEKN